ncbi:hypothetical protein C27AD_09571 [Salinisphaera hydrothermalis C27AD]
MAALVFAGTAFASQIDVNTNTGNEPSLYDIAHDSGLPNVNSNSPQVNAGYWRLGLTNSSSSVLEATWTSNYNSATFGVYDPNDPSNRLNILGAGTQIGPDVSGTTGYLKYHKSTGKFASYYTDSSSKQYGLSSADFGGDVFGYFLTIGGKTYYSDSKLNGGTDRMVGYEASSDGKGLKNEYLFGWEDGTDNDYQDYVATVESVKPVPEPSSIAMFGVGLLMIGFAARRLQKRDV